MKKILIITFSFIFISIILFVSYLTIFGYETNRFNNIVIKEIEKSKFDLKVKLNKIKIKIDLKKLSLFLSTSKPEIYYGGENLPVNIVKIYLNFKSILNPNNLLERIYIDTREIEAKTLKNLAISIKPSNFKNFLLNNLKEGKIKANFDLNFDQSLKIINYNIDGFVKKAKIDYSDKFLINDLKFIFLLTKENLNVDAVSGKINNIPIKDGTIAISRSLKTKIKGSVSSSTTLDEVILKKIGIFKNFKDLQNNKYNLKVNLNSDFNLLFDDTLNLENYSFKINCDLNNSIIELKKPFKNNFLDSEVKNIYINKTNLKYNKNSKQIDDLIIEGSYNFNKSENKKFIFQREIIKNIQNYNLNLDISDKLKIDILNYSKKQDKIANLVTNFSVMKNGTIIKDLIFEENKNLIKIEDLRIGKNNQIKSLKSIDITTYNNNKLRNKFKISLDKKLKIIGESFDSSNLSKIFDNNSNKNFIDFDTNVEIKIKNVYTKLPEILKNFILIGEIKKGKFSKITSKGEFSNGKYLDISLKKDKNSEKKYLEIYSDIQEPLLSNYGFLKSISGGNLLFNSVIDDKTLTSKILIENFKIKDAPDFMKLLALADLAGMADLVSGKGLSFDKMEIKFTKNKKILKLEELYTVGPSISILMEGYIDNDTGLVSLRGTMVPAKELNKLISKIPVIGDILIPKEIGEGLFGVSFKMKGIPGDIKTSVNPIRTLTPRFIQKALEKKTN